MNKSALVLLALLAPMLLFVGCAPQNADLVQAVKLDSFSTENAPMTEGDCPVSQAPNPAFIPPSPWPADPPSATEFWYGTADLWTALPKSGSWRQLALGEKFWLWSEHYSQFDVPDDPTPDVTLSAQRLDDPAPEFFTDEATNGFHHSFYQAMLVGVTLDSPGCWQFEANFKDAKLSFVLWIPFE